MAPCPNGSGQTRLVPERCGEPAQKRRRSKSPSSATPHRVKDAHHPFVASGITLKSPKIRPVLAGQRLLLRIFSICPRVGSEATSVTNDLSGTAFTFVSQPVHSFTSLVLLGPSSLAKHRRFVIVASAANCPGLSYFASGTYLDYLALCYKSARKRAPCHPHSFRRPGTAFANFILRSPPHYRALLIAAKATAHTSTCTHATPGRSLRQSLAFDKRHFVAAVDCSPFCVRYPA